MHATPHPTALEATLPLGPAIDQNRDVFCLHYAVCLDEAIAAHWCSFSCANCPLFAVHPGDHDSPVTPTYHA